MVRSRVGRRDSRNHSRGAKVRTPEEVVTAAFAAINMEDWHGLTALCDPLSLAVFKGQTVRNLTRLADWYGLAPHDPDFDPMEKIKHAADPEFFVRSEIAGVESLEALRSMDPARIFAGWLRARSFADCADDEELGVSRDPASPGKRRIRNYRYSVVGSVLDGTDISYVLFRPTATYVETYPEAYAACLKTFSDDERHFDAAMHHRGDPVTVICRKQSDNSWLIVAKRSFFLLDTLEVVEVRLPK